MSAEDFRPLKYRGWLDNRFNDDLEDDDDEMGVDEPQPEEPLDDGFPSHDDYSEESRP